MTAAKKDNGCRLITTATEAPHARGSMEKASSRHSHVSPWSQGQRSKLHRLSRPTEPAPMRNKMQMHPKHSYGEHRKENESIVSGSITGHLVNEGFNEAILRHDGVERGFNVFHSSKDFVSKCRTCDAYVEYDCNLWLGSQTSSQHQHGTRSYRIRQHKGQSVQILDACHAWTARKGQ